MKRKIGTGIIVVAVLIWLMYFITQFPNVLSKEPEINSFSRSVLAVVTLICGLLTFLGFHLKKEN